jgi:HSP20 family protein
MAQQTETRLATRPTTPLGLLGWDPFEEMRRFRQHFDQMFEQLFGPTPSVGALEPMPWRPALNLYRDEDNLICECALPGMKKEDIDVQITGDVLSISGQVRQEKEIREENLYRREISGGRFARAIQLPVEVNRDKVKAEYRDGILRLTMPLAEPARHKGTRIQVT